MSHANRPSRTLGTAALAALLAAAPSAAGANPNAATPAERRILAARKQIDLQPSRAQPYTDLALALARRARETGDPDYYVEAARALQRALALEPDGIEARKAEVWVLLGQHRFAEALPKARALLARMPDDPMAYGLLADALVELGHYSEAEEAVQWMLDLRPGTVAALTRAAYLRELFGDLEGAIELMDAAFQRTPPTEAEDRAWILTQLAHLQRESGRTALAEETAQLALTLFPRYHYALGELAAIRGVQGRHEDAVALVRQRYEAAQHPEHLFALAEALARAGRHAEAAAAFRDFERTARAESAEVDNANRELILYLVDRAGRPDEALEVALREIGRRRDIFTLDAYAWALSAAGRHREAKAAMDEALAVGTVDSRIRGHARVIASRLEHGPGRGERP
jgi:tetratricopeptide (TPR) repeat protein